MRRPSPDEMDAIAQSALFREAGADPVRAIAMLLRVSQLAPAEVLFRVGDVGSDGYVVLSGEVDLLEGEGDGASLIVRLERGDFFGEVGLFGGGARTATARAHTDATIGALSHDGFVEVMRTWPEVALALLRLQAKRFAELRRRHNDLLASRK